MTDLKKDSLALIKYLNNAGSYSLIVGGAVRDYYLSKKESIEYLPKDIDISTSLGPDSILEIVSENKDFSVVDVGRAFSHGVVNVMYNGEIYEVASLRESEDYDSVGHSHHAEVTFSNIRYSGVVGEELESAIRRDLARRDLTVNAMAFDPVTKDVYDYVGGRVDIESGLIRFVGDASERILEDPIRSMRFLRWASRFSFDYDSTHLSEMLGATDLSCVSMERVSSELFGIMSTGAPSISLKVLLTSSFRFTIPFVEYGKISLSDEDLLLIDGLSGIEERYCCLLSLGEGLTLDSRLSFMIKSKSPGVDRAILSSLIKSYYLADGCVSERVLTLGVIRCVIESVDPHLEYGVDGLLGSFARVFDFLNKCGFGASFDERDLLTPVVVKQLPIRGGDVIRAGVDPKQVGLFLTSVLKKIELGIIPYNVSKDSIMEMAVQYSRKGVLIEK